MSDRVRDFIIENKPESGVTVYATCPACNSNGKFSMTNMGGYVLYHCFRNSCGLKPGRVDFNRTHEDLQAYIQGRRERKEFVLPDRLAKAYTNLEVRRYLEKYNSLEAYEKGLVDIAYDPKLNRLVWIVWDSGRVVGAVGRLLGVGIGPKAVAYPNSLPVPLKVGTGKNLFLVEDCASACSIARLPDVTGMALLGTNFKDEYLPYVMGYDSITIALDKDARLKTLKLKKYLSLFNDNVGVWFLDKDIKDMNKEELDGYFSK